MASLRLGQTIRHDKWACTPIYYSLDLLPMPIQLLCVMQNGYTAMGIAKNHATHLGLYLQQARSLEKWACPSIHKKAYTLCLRPL